MVELGRLIDALSEQLGSMGIGCVVESGTEQELYLEADEGGLRTAALLLTAHLVEQAPERPVHFSVETAIVDGAAGMDSRKYAVLEVRSGVVKDAEGGEEKFMDDSSACRQLAIHSAYKILNGIGGTVSAEGTDSKIYRVYLPTISAREMVQSPKTVLLLEDEAYVRNVTREVLECEGYNVLEAQSPAEAIELFRNAGCKVDLLLSDVVLPGMNGLQFASCLNDIAPNVKALFMSGYGELTQLREETSGWRTPYIQKPFTIETLVARVREVLNNDLPYMPPSRGSAELSGVVQ
jgi:CheY-like chemotaxis protein